MKSKSTQLAITAMFLATGLALFNTIWAVYLESVIHNVALVGTISGIFALLGVLFLIFSTPIIERFAETKLWIWSILTSATGFLSFYYIDSIFWLLVVAVIIIFSGVIRMQANGILVRDLTKASNIGRSEGLQYALNNVGWMVGPLIAGLIAEKFGIRAVFIFVTFFCLTAYFSFKNIHIKDKNRFTEDDGKIRSTIKNLKSYFKNPERLKNYFLSGGINLYWGTIFLFIPLFIIKQELPAYWIGIFLFITALPLVILEYTIGSKADREGFKKFFITGYLILATCSFIAFFFEDIISWIIIFVIASFGAAMLEGTTESYFFKTVKRKEEEKYYGPYNTSIYLVSGAGKLIISGALFFIANKYVFLLLSAEMFLLFLVALTIKDKTSHTSRR